MKWMRFFLLLILVPGFSYAFFDYKECNKMKNDITTEWGAHSELLEQFNKIEIKEKEQHLFLVKEAIMCCQRANVHNEKILNKISHIKSKKERTGNYWRQETQEREAFKKSVELEIRTLNAYLLEAPKKIAMQLAAEIWHASVKTAEQANATVQKCERRLSNVDEVVATMHEASGLFAKASSQVEEALQLISPFKDEPNEKALKETIANYQDASEKCKQDAEGWPETVAKQMLHLKKQLADLKEERKLFEDKDLQNYFLSHKNQCCLF